MYLVRMPLWVLWLLSPVIVLSVPPADRLACIGGIVFVSVLGIAWARLKGWADTRWPDPPPDTQWPEPRQP